MGVILFLLVLFQCLVPEQNVTWKPVATDGRYSRNNAHRRRQPQQVPDFVADRGGGRSAAQERRRLRRRARGAGFAAHPQRV